MDGLWDLINDFSTDYSEYLPESIPRLDKFPTSNEFLNDYVLLNLPFIVRCEEVDRFPAVELWKDENYLRKLMRKKMVTVAVTPDGRADSIVDDRFMIPEERTMLFDEFYDEFLMYDRDQVFYLQKQNNNLIEEFSPLVRDVASHVSWATEAFGEHPDAANIWMGDDRSVTSLHRDHYENIYYVITGQKTFTLYPPVSVGWMPYKKCKKFQWHLEGTCKAVPRKWTMKDMNEEVEWILPSHKPDTLNHLKLYLNTKSYVINVCPGDVLYLPAMWFHEVRQSRNCIAVNYWYDMKYDLKYPFLQLFSKICHMDKYISRRDASVDKQTELEYSLLGYLVEQQKKNIGEEVKKEVYACLRKHKE